MNKDGCANLIAIFEAFDKGIGAEGVASLCRNAFMENEQCWSIEWRKGDYRMKRMFTEPGLESMPPDLAVIIGENTATDTLAKHAAMVAKASESALTPVHLREGYHGCERY